MTRTYIHIASILMTILCCACGEKANTSHPQTGYLLVFGEDSCRCIGYNDKPVFTKSYNEISLYYNRLALAQTTDDKKWGYINSKGDFVLPAIYDKATVFSEGLAWVLKKGDMPSIINTKGNIKFSQRETYQVKSFHEGHAAFAIRKKNITYWGFLNKQGQEAIRPQFRDVQDFHQGFAAVQDNTTGLWGYIDLSGVLMIDYSYQEATPFNKDGNAIVKTKNGYQIINRIGETIKELPFETVCADNDCIRIMQDSKWGWCDKEGKIIIQPTFEDSRPFGKSTLAPVLIREKWGYINKKGDIVIKRQFTDAYPFIDGRAAVKAGILWGFINENGSYVVNPQYENIPQDYLHQASGNGSVFTSLSFEP